MHPENNVKKTDLIELLQVNSVDLTLSNTFDVQIIDTKGFLCKRCRRWSSEKQDELCERCEKIVEIFI